MTCIFTITYGRACTVYFSFVRNAIAKLKSTTETDLQWHNHLGYPHLLRNILTGPSTALAQLTSSWCCKNMNEDMVFFLKFIFTKPFNILKKNYLQNLHLNIAHVKDSNSLLTGSEPILCIWAASTPGRGTGHVCSPFRNLWQLGRGTTPDGISKFKKKLFHITTLSKALDLQLIFFPL